MNDPPPGDDKRDEHRDRSGERTGPLYEDTSATPESEEWSAGSDERQSPGETGDVGPGEKQDSVFRAIAAATGVGVGGVLSAVMIFSIIGRVVISLEPPGTGILILLVVVGQFVWFPAFGFFYLRQRGLTWEDIRAYLGIKRPGLKDIGLIIGTWFAMSITAGIVGNIVIRVVPELLGSNEQQMPADNPVEGIIAANPELVAVAVLFMFLVVGPCEEILFRGVVQNRLRETLSAVPSIVIASAVFAAIHVVALAGQDPVGIAMTITILFFPALGFGAIYEYTDNIVIPSLLHGFHNSMVVLAIYASTVYDIETAIVLRSLLSMPL